MITKPAPGRQFFDLPATYQIQIQGRIEASWSEYLEGMVIQESELGGGAPVTTLYGELPDQAALARTQPALPPAGDSAGGHPD